MTFSDSLWNSVSPLLIASRESARTVILFAMLLLLAGCAANPWPEFDQGSTTNDRQALPGSRLSSAGIDPRAKEVEKSLGIY